MAQRPDVLPRGLLNVGIVLPQFLFWSDFYIMSTFSPSGATAYSANTLTMAIGFTFLYLELAMRTSHASSSSAVRRAPLTPTRGSASSPSYSAPSSSRSSAG